MIQDLQLYSAFPLVGGIMALALGVSLLRKNRHNAIVNGFFALMLLFLVAGIFDFLMINADPGNALFFTRVALFFVTMIFAGFFYITTQLSLIPLSKWFKRNRYVYYAISAAVGLAVVINLKRVGHNDFGFGPPRNYDTIIILIAATVFAAASLSLLARRWLATKNQTERSESVLLSLAVLMPYLWGIVLEFLRFLQIHIPSELSPGFLVSSLIIAYSVHRHRLFTILPVSEDRAGIIGAKEGAVLQAGTYLLFEEAEADGMYEELLTQVSNGIEGLIVTRTYPEDLRDKYGLKRTPVIWLCSQPGQDRVDPSNITILEHTIMEFIRNGHKTVVAIDGLEYLISNNGPGKVLRLLYALRDEVLMNQSRMIVTLDPGVLDPREIAFFERDFEVVRK
jgi:hypothetical protein